MRIHNDFPISINIGVERTRPRMIASRISSNIRFMLISFNLPFICPDSAEYQNTRMPEGCQVPPHATSLPISIFPGPSVAGYIDIGLSSVVVLCICLSLYFRGSKFNKRILILQYTNIYFEDQGR